LHGCVVDRGCADVGIIVQSDPGDVEFGGQPVEGLGEVVGVNGRPVGASEHEPRVVGPDAGLHVGFELSLPPRAQDRDGARVEVDGAEAVGALDVGYDHLVVGRSHGLGDGEPGVVEVDDPPGEAE